MPELEDVFGSTAAAEQTPPETTTATAAQTAPETTATASYVPPPTPAATVQQPTGQQPSGQQVQTQHTAAQGFSNSSLYARAKAAGLPLDGINSEADFAQAILDRYVAERPYADYGRTTLAAPNAQQPGTQEEGDEDQKAGDDGEDAFDLDGHFSSLWSAPQLDQQAQAAIQYGIVRLGENGLYEAAPGFEAMALPLLNTLNQAHIAQKTQLQKYFEGNPYKSHYEAQLPAVKNLIQQEVRRHLSEQFQNRDIEGFQNQWIADNKSWLYDSTGQLSADGLKFSQTYAAMQPNWKGDQKQLVEYALKISGANTQPAAAAAPNQPPAASTQNPPAQQDQRQRDEQGRFLPAGTPAPVAPPPKTKQESFIDEARRKAAATGSTQNGYSQTGSEFLAANDGELDNLWSTEWQRHKAGAAA